MSASKSSPKIVRDILLQLHNLCDTGFAAAVHIRYTRPSLLYQTYNQKWSDHYSEMGYMMVDPVVHWGLAHDGLIRWDDLSDKDTAGVLVSALEHGLENGWTYSVGVPESRTIAGLTKSGAPFTQAQVDHIIALVDSLHEATIGIDTFSPETMHQLREITF
jgi:LuxR family transcriptional regulator, quorum-sensing system regulator SdiA